MNEQIIPITVYTLFPQVQAALEEKPFLKRKRPRRDGTMFQRNISRALVYDASEYGAWKN